jgi:hypothetical protein
MTIQTSLAQKKKRLHVLPDLYSPVIKMPKSLREPLHSLRMILRIVMPVFMPLLIQVQHLFIWVLVSMRLQTGRLQRITSNFSPIHKSITHMLHLKQMDFWTTVP